METSLENPKIKTFTKIYQIDSETNELKYFEVVLDIELNEEKSEQENELFVKKSIQDYLYQKFGLYFTHLVKAIGENNFKQVIPNNIFIKNFEDIKWINANIDKISLEERELNKNGLDEKKGDIPIYPLDKLMQFVGEQINKTQNSHTLNYLFYSGLFRDKDWNLLDVHPAEFLGLSPEDYKLYIAFINSKSSSLTDFLKKHQVNYSNKAIVQFEKNISYIPQRLGRNLLKIIHLSFRNFFSSEISKEESYKKINDWLKESSSEYARHTLTPEGLEVNTTNEIDDNFQSAIKMMIKIYNLSNTDQQKINTLYTDFLKNNLNSYDIDYKRLIDLLINSNNDQQKINIFHKNHFKRSLDHKFLFKKFSNFKTDSDILLLKRFFSIFWVLNVIESQPYNQKIEIARDNFTADLKSLLTIPTDKNESIKFTPRSSSVDKQSVKWDPPRIKTIRSRAAKLLRIPKQRGDEQDVIATRFICESIEDAEILAKKIKNNLNGESYKWISVPETKNTATNRTSTKLLLLVNRVPTEIQIFPTQKAFDQQEFNENHHDLYRDIIQDYITRGRGGVKISQEELKNLYSNLILNTDVVLYHGATRTETLFKIKKIIMLYFSKYNSHYLSTESLTRGLKYGYEKYHPKYYKELFNHLNHLNNYETHKDDLANKLYNMIKSIPNENDKSQFIRDFIKKYIPQYENINKNTEIKSITETLSKKFPKTKEIIFNENYELTGQDINLKLLIEIAITNEQCNYSNIVELSKQFREELIPYVSNPQSNMKITPKNLTDEEWRNYFLHAKIPEGVNKDTIKKITSRCKITPLTK